MQMETPAADVKIGQVPDWPAAGEAGGARLRAGVWYMMRFPAETPSLGKGADLFSGDRASDA
jgi:hypothetical protein